MMMMMMMRVKRTHTIIIVINVSAAAAVVSSVVVVLRNSVLCTKINNTIISLESRNAFKWKSISIGLCVSVLKD